MPLPLLAGPAAGTVAVDHNHGFPAPALLDRAGNPVGRLPHIPLVAEELSAPTRDGHLRQAITQLLDRAEASGAGSITIEDRGGSPLPAVQPAELDGSWVLALARVTVLVRGLVQVGSSHPVEIRRLP